MKVLILCNNAFVQGNGLCTAICSYVERLREAGVDARLMAAENSDKDGKQPDFPLEHFKFPIFEPVIYANGFRYARTDRARLREAFEWADVIHIQEAFMLEMTAVKLAAEMRKPVVGTFHLFPHNVMANLGLGKVKFLSDAVMYMWRKTVFDYCSIVHCPTMRVKEILEEYGFKSEMRVISNGIDVPEDVEVRSAFPTDPVDILCIGRLSNEKAQQTLLNAMRYSKYADRIRLRFAGRGPYADRYRKIADKLMVDGVLRYKPEFGFYTHEQLRELARNAYLYIHNAWVEVEGLSCVEAIREGAVPVIAKGPLSATTQFALDERSVYPVFDAPALAAKIDWWIEHPEERIRMGREYADSVNRYEQHKCTEELISMYRDAIAK